MAEKRGPQESVRAQKDSVLEQAVELRKQEEDILDVNPGLPVTQQEEALNALEKQWVKSKFKRDDNWIEEYYANPSANEVPERIRRRINELRIQFWNHLEEEVRDYKRQEKRADRKEVRKGRRARRRGEEGAGEVTVVEGGAGYAPGLAGAPETREAVGLQTHGSIEKLKNEIQAFLSENVALVVQNMVTATPPLTPGDLLAGDKQSEAIDAALIGHPQLAATLKVMLSMDSKTKEYQEAQAIVEAMANTLKEAYKLARETQVAIEEVEADTLFKGAKNKFKHLAHEVAKQPGEALVYTAGLVIALTVLWNWSGESGKIRKGMKWLGMFAAGTAVVGGALYGADFAARSLSETGRGIFDWMGYRPDTFRDSAALQRFRTLFAGMTPPNQQAAHDLLRLGNTKSSLIIDAYEDAYRNQKQSIDPLLFLGEGEDKQGVDTATVRAMNDKASYQAIDHIVQICATKAGKPGDREAGIRYWRETVARISNPTNRRGKQVAMGQEVPLFILILDLKLPKSAQPTERNPDGTDASSGSLSEGPLSLEQARQKANVVDLFNSFDVEYAGYKPRVEFKGEVNGIPYLEINGYPYQYFYNKEKNVHVLTDPFTKKPYTLTYSLQVQNVFLALVEHSQNQMAARFEQQFKLELAGYPNMTVHYKPKDNAWNIVSKDPPHKGIVRGGVDEPTPLCNMGLEEYEVPIRVVADIHNTYLALQLEGQPKYQKKATLKGILAEGIELKVSERVNADLAHLRGGVEFRAILDGPQQPFYVDSRYKAMEMDPDPKVGQKQSDRTCISIETAEGTHGVLIYNRGQLEDIQLDASTQMQTAWENIAQEQADSFVRNNPKIQEACSQLVTAYEAHWHSGGKLEQAWKLLTRVGAAVELSSDGSAPFFYGKETNWQEVIDYKVRDEYGYYMKRRFMDILNPPQVYGKARTKPPMNRGAYEIEVEHLVKNQAEAVKSLVKIANEIYNLRDSEDGEVLERALVSGAYNLDVWHYPSERYVQFIHDAEALMHHPGYDWLGADGMETARKIRDEARLLLYEYTWPIGTLSDAEFAANPDYEGHLQYVLGKFEVILNEAQWGQKGNLIIGGVTLDRRIEDTELRRLFKAKVHTFNERVPVSTYFGGVTTTIGAVTEVPDPTAGLSEARGLRELLGTGEEEVAYASVIEAKDLDAKLKAAREELEDIYQPLDAFERSFKDDPYDAYLGYYLSRIMEKIGKEASKPPKGETVDSVIIAYLDGAREDVREYIKYESYEETNDPVILIEIMEKLTETMAIDADPDSAWAEPSKEMLRWFTGNFEFENSVWRDNPDIFIQFMKGWFEKGPNSEGGKDADVDLAKKYQRYYAYTASKLMPGDKNWSLDNFDGKLRQIDSKDWLGLRTTFAKIFDFNEWKDNGSPLAEEVLRENDLQFAVKEGVDRDKQKVRKEFIKWYDEEMDLGEWTRIEGSFPGLVRQHAIERMLEIDAECATSEQLGKALSRFKDYLRVEKSFYDWILETDVEVEGEKYKVLFALYPALIGGAAGMVATLLGGPAGLAGLGALGGGLIGESSPSLGLNYGETLHAQIRTDIDKVFKENWDTKNEDPANKNPDKYRIALEEALDEMIQNAAKADKKRIDLGPASIKLAE